jgi:ABC-type oligopeptide transport system substrate-binding subunit
MSRRIARLTAVAVLSAAVLLTAACTSSSSSSAQASGITPEEQFTPLFFQCLAQHNVPLWDKSAGSAGEYVTVAAAGKKQGWYVNGKIVESNPESSA